MSPETLKPPAKKGKSTNSELLGKAATIALWELSRRGLKPRVEDPNNYFQEAKDFVANGGTLIVFINHSTFIDTNEVGHVMEDHVAPLDHVGAIIAINQFDNQEGYQHPEGNMSKKIASRLASVFRKAEYWLIDSASKTKGFKLIPLIREKDKLQNPIRYAQPSRATGGLTPDQFNNESFRDLLGFIKQHRGKVVMFAPEGEVNQDGVLTQAEPGLGDLLRIGRKNGLKAMGIALTPKAYLGGSARPTQLYSYEEAVKLQEQLQTGIDRQGTLDAEGNPLQVTVSDALMLQIARLVPERYQGYYRKFLTSNT